MKQYIAALDQGTTSSRCVIFDWRGEPIVTTQKEYTQHYPRNGWVEHDPNEIWSSQYGVFQEALAKCNLTPDAIAAIGITNQRETTIVWDKATGEPIYPAIVWQCRRTADMVGEWGSSGFSDSLQEKTGLIPDAYFSASKIKWILDNVDGAKSMAANGRLSFGTVDAWLIYKLTKGKVFATDYTNASRTMLYNIRTLDWDDDILGELGIPRSMLPEVKPSSGIYGYTDPSLFDGRPIPITGVAGDQQAALFGQCCFQPGEAKNTYGTGCFLLMHTGGTPVRSHNGLLTTIAASAGRNVEYALEGSVFVAGAAVQWLRDELGLIGKAHETEALALSVEDTGGVYVVPAFTGLGAPYWDPYARGAVLGLTRGTKKAHFVRAVLESIAYQTYDLLKAMEDDSHITMHSLRVDGGACANHFLMQFQADILSANVVRPRIIESTALGAAYLAGLAIGYYPEQGELYKNNGVDRTFTPQKPPKEAASLLAGWEKAVEVSRKW